MFAALNSFQVGGSTPTFVSDVFSTTLYTGNGSTQTITNGIDLAGEGGLVWVKDRVNAGRSHALNHGETSGPSGLYLSSNTTSGNSGATGYFHASNGFTLGNDATTNTSSANYVSWTFRQAPKFFDVVTGTCDGSGNITVNHSLGSVPGFVTIKRTDGVSAWLAYHTSLGNNQYVYLNATNAAATLSSIWNATSTTFTANVGFAAGAQVVLYLFAHNAGGFGGYGADSIISCGSTNGSKVTLGYQPQWILYKSMDFSEYWQIVDSQRGLPVGSPAQLLKPNSTDAETTTSNNITVESDGFTLGAVTGTVIYVAIKAS